MKSLCRVSLTLAVLFITISVVQATVAPSSDKFGKFDIYDPTYGHPLFRHLAARNNSRVDAITAQGAIAPFVLSEFFYKEGRNVSQKTGTTLHPEGASYRMLGTSFESEETLYESIDALSASHFTTGSLIVRLRRKAEVVLVLQYRNKHTASRMQKARLFPGSCANWLINGPAFRKAICKDRDCSAEKSFKAQSEESGVAISLRMTEAHSIGSGLFELKLPNVNQIKLSGIGKPYNYIVLLVDPKTGTRFPYPQTPRGFGFKESIRPLTVCPSELHALWKSVPDDANANDRDNYAGGRWGGSMIEYPTWHPPIDPIYYCTYGHDHGSYPGKYKPAFTHVDRKTTAEMKDIAVVSDNYKVFTMFEESHTNKGKSEWLHWIFVVAIPMVVSDSDLKRQKLLAKRYHAVHVSIFDDEFKNVMAKFQLLNDYGYAATMTRESGLEPLNKVMRKIQIDRGAARLAAAFRQFNLRSGHLERCRASLNTCTPPRRAFVIDMNIPQTGKLPTEGATDGKEVLDFLHRGQSFKRSFFSRGFKIDFTFCSWKNDLKGKGRDELIRFHTDALFRRVLPPIEHTISEGRSTRNYVVQFIRRGFYATLPEGRYSESDFSQGKFVRNSESTTLARWGIQEASRHSLQPRKGEDEMRGGFGTKLAADGRNGRAAAEHWSASPKEPNTLRKKEESQSNILDAWNDERIGMLTTSESEDQIVTFI